MDIVHPAVESYMEELARGDDEPVLLEMEAHARERGFPIIGRLCGRLLEVLARSIKADRVFELGSGFGYSGYWFSRAIGPQGELHLSDGDPDNQRAAMGYLRRAGLDGPVTYHVGDALEAMAATEGTFDIVYCDIDKDGYPRAWEEARRRVKVGGLYLCDNMLWSGRVTGASTPPDVRAGYTEAIDQTNRAISNDDSWRSTIVPTRDGVMVAVRVR